MKGIKDLKGLIAALDEAIEENDPSHGTTIPYYNFLDEFLPNWQDLSYEEKEACFESEQEEWAAYLYEHLTDGMGISFDLNPYL